jgi:chromosome segregation ATPase
MAPPVRPQNSQNSSDFRVNSETQNRRDNTRRKILEDELATEQQALEAARLKLKEGQDNPEVYKTAGGQTFRNVAKYDEKVNALQEDVTAHEKNIEALKTELSHLN